MHELVVALGVSVFTMCALLIAAALWLRWRMHRLLRVKPGVKSPAPASWVLSTSEPARLHRRLRRSAASARSAAATGGPAVASLAGQIEDEAVRIEAQLVAFSRIWRTERDTRKRIAAQVTELEHLTVRVAGMTGTAALPAGSPDSLRDLRERLDALDAAREELSYVERQSGLESA